MRWGNPKSGVGTLTCPATKERGVWATEDEAGGRDEDGNLTISATENMVPVNLYWLIGVSVWDEKTMAEATVSGATALLTIHWVGRGVLNEPLFPLHNPRLCARTHPSSIQ